MILTLILTVALMILLFLSIWMATIFMPFAALAKNFPKDVQERLKPRLAELEKRPFKKKFIGQIIFILCMSAMLVVMLIGGIDGIHHNYDYWQFLLRFLIMGIGVKAFDIIGLDFFLLTKTHFFQHYLPETEGCAGWQNFGYNRKQQLKHCAMIPVCCAVMAWIFTL